MDFAAVSSKGICIDDSQGLVELSPTGYVILQDIFLLTYLISSYCFEMTNLQFHSFYRQSFCGSLLPQR